MNIKRIENQMFIISALTAEQLKTLESQNQNVVKDDKGNAVYAVGMGTGKLSENMVNFNHVTQSGKVAIVMEFNRAANTPENVEDSTKHFVEKFATALANLEANEATFVTRAEAVVTKNAEILASIETVAID